MQNVAEIRQAFTNFYKLMQNLFVKFCRKEYISLEIFINFFYIFCEFLIIFDQGYIRYEKTILGIMRFCEEKIEKIHRFLYTRGKSLLDLFKFMKKNYLQKTQKYAQKMVRPTKANDLKP